MISMAGQVRPAASHASSENSVLTLSSLKEELAGGVLIYCSIYMYLFNVEDVFVQIIKYICLKGELTGKHGKCHGLLQHLSVGRNVFGNIIETHLARSGKYIFII